MNKKNDVLFIAPLTPPITGQYIISRDLLEVFKNNWKINPVDLSSGGLKNGSISIRKIFVFIQNILTVFKFRKKSKIIYFTISESFFGSIKDLIIYLICFFYLQKVVIHLHGGSIRRDLWNKNNLLFILNRFFLKRCAAIIVTSSSHLSIFSDFISRSRLYVVSNYVNEKIFVSDFEIMSKYFTFSEKIIVLYLSNMIPKKGYEYLLNSFFELDLSVRKKIYIEFAGAFASTYEELEFFEKTSGFDNIRYHGVIHDIYEKRKLLASAHIFCFPSLYYEGQPVSILEAYASGCVVMTTNQPGISDFFVEKKNGLLISKKSSKDIADALIYFANKKEECISIAFQNNFIAKRIFQKKIFITKMSEIFNSV
jgi:glycosyltransferase involved in cell wall biosynthesis